MGDQIMEKKLSIEKVTALLQAVEKIKSARDVREGGNVSVRPDTISMLHDAMQIVCEYLPDTHKNNFSNALKSSHHYCGTYKNLKSHIRELDGQNPDFDNISKTVKVIMPMLDNRQKAPINKILNVLEALRN
jgi:hypothetical protein